ncbi:MAG: DNA photolyase family protein [Aquimonas sp.]|nr:DNA photolyase family protein [Aquimonas sp.]
MPHALIWLRRDLRLSDHLPLDAALQRGQAPVFVYVHAPEEEGEWAPGGASLAWLHRSLQALAEDLRKRGSALLVRHGPSLDALLKLAGECKAEAVYWQRRYEPAVIDRDTSVKASLKAAGLHAESFRGATLFERDEVMTGSGGPYRVFTPFWRNARPRLEAGAAIEAPARLPAPPVVDSLPIEALGLSPRLGWDAGFWERFVPGETGAGEALEAFIEGAAASYVSQRDLPDRAGTSRLSPHLHFGEITPAQILRRLQREPWPAAAGEQVEGYIRELGWREFNAQLLYHYPRTASENLNAQFDGFGWNPPDQKLEAWQRGRTGIPIVDAGMRELWHTGWMHNRVRMIVASFLTKNLRLHWLHGARWFWDTLVDADLANNTGGWQWSAGTGADAAPYFRIFNPVTQAQKFDARGSYIRQWVPELARLPDKALYAPFEHADLHRRIAPEYPCPVVELKASREEALAAYASMRS